MILTLLIFSVAVFAASTTGTVKCNGNLNVRKSYSTSSAIVRKLPNGTIVTITGSQNVWYKISYSGVVGWVFGQYIKTSTAPSTTTVSTTNSQSKVQLLIAYAKKLIGTKYVYGGSSPGGFDCSGFTKYVYNKIGISIPHSAVAQATQGRLVSKSALISGDIVFFDTNGGHNSISHVGLYIGSGMMIDAESGSARSVTISSLSTQYWSGKYVTARRIL